ncbi:hypothetical protein PR048_003598 [Dryococelus australis]|uniref:DDE Tnp4 domain-containing protein n=1 Tax=Dryococelus australis TaxID=614101 RepID=A0ABQ9IQD2_9NEOP|nr:hypothetical protein PR048_003598 [Dryococelus australis]
MADIGCNGRVSDGGVIEETTFDSKLKDEAFALRENLLKPFPRTDLTYETKIYNYRLCRARRCEENASGILASLLRIFRMTNHLEPYKVDYVVMAYVALHDFLRRRNRTQYTSGSMLDRGNLEEACVEAAGYKSNLNDVLIVFVMWARGILQQKHM